MWPTGNSQLMISFLLCSSFSTISKGEYKKLDILIGQKAQPIMLYWLYMLGKNYFYISKLGYKLPLCHLAKTKMVNTCWMKFSFLWKHGEFWNWLLPRTRIVNKVVLSITSRLDWVPKTYFSYSTVQKECKWNSLLFVTFQCFSMKFKEISSETIFHTKFDEFSKGLF